MAFAVAAWIFAGLQMGLSGALDLTGTRIVPDLVLILMVFIAVNAPPAAALWSALGLGLIVDLITGAALAEGDGVRTVLGPNAVGYVLAAQLALAMRSMLNRRNPLTIAFLGFAGCLVSQIVVMTILALHRAFGDPLVAGGMSEFWSRVGASIYTGVAGAVLALALNPLLGLFGFANVQGRRFGGGRN